VAELLMALYRFAEVGRRLLCGQICNVCR